MLTAGRKSFLIQLKAGKPVEPNEPFPDGITVAASGITGVDFEIVAHSEKVTQEKLRIAEFRLLILRDGYYTSRIEAGGGTYVIELQQLEEDADTVVYRIYADTADGDDDEMTNPPPTPP